MRLYLVRHGKAEQLGGEWERPLTARGQRDVIRMAAYLDKVDCRVTRIVHSGRMRARQTAELLSGAIGPQGRVEEMRDGLQPDDGTDLLARAAAGWNDDVMAVGHQPFMGRMAAELLCGNPEVPLLVVKTGTVICLERIDDGVWSLRWMIAPSMVA